jgi:hypothetical protein
MATFNTTLINNAIDGAFKAGDTYGEKVAELQRLLKGADRDTVKDYVAPRAAKRYGAEYVDGKWTDSDCAAKRYTNRLINDIMGKSSARKEEVAVPAEILKAAEKLAALCNEYKKAKSLASTALALAFAA